MVFSTIANRDAFGPVDSLLLLRDIEDGAEAATVSEAGISFPVNAEPEFGVAVAVSSVSGTTDGSNYWTISVEVSDVVGGTYTEVGSYQASGTEESPVKLAFTRSQVMAIDNDAKWVRVTATKTGTSATDITYGAWIC